MSAHNKSGFVTVLALLLGVSILVILLILNLEHASNILRGVRSSLKGVPEISNNQTEALVEDLSNPNNKSSEVDISATFEIYTRGTKRIFTDSKYHNLSTDVYILSQDPGVIYVKKEEITWSNFFNTLPMSLSKECLVTGTNQTFCTGENGILRFFINGVENRNALDLEIQNQDSLVVKFE